MFKIEDIINQVHCSDCLSFMRQMPDESVQCVVTSPPYWSLRNYGVAGQLGLEKTPEEYINKMVEVFREVRRVLRSDGTAWLNMGDSYVSNPSGKASGGFDNYFRTDERETLNKPHQGANTKRPSGLKPKDLCGMPWRLAFALQADGWWLRSAMPWLKRNSMPESVTDRPASAVEYVFLLTKSAKYFYDSEAVSLPHKRDWSGCGGNLAGKGTHKINDEIRDIGDRAELKPNPAGRNRRNSDWFFESWQGLYEENDEPLALIVNPQGFKEAHFATFGEKFVEPMIKAGTSERGACEKCGAPWERVVESEPATSKECPKTQAAHEQRGGTGRPTGTVGKSGGGRIEGYSETLGWRPACSCEAETRPCIVLDPFSGAGTVAVVAEKLGRRWLGIELNLEYIEMSNRRIGKAQKTIREQGKQTELI